MAWELPEIQIVGVFQIERYLYRRRRRRPLPQSPTTTMAASTADLCYACHRWPAPRPPPPPTTLALCHCFPLAKRGGGSPLQFAALKTAPEAALLPPPTSRYIPVIYFLILLDIAFELVQTFSFGFVFLQSLTRRIEVGCMADCFLLNILMVSTNL